MKYDPASFTPIYLPDTPILSNSFMTHYYVFRSALVTYAHTVISCAWLILFIIRLHLSLKHKCV